MDDTLFMNILIAHIRENWQLIFQSHFFSLGSWMKEDFCLSGDS